MRWARVAGVHCIEVDYARLWTGLAAAILAAGPDNDLVDRWGANLNGRVAIRSKMSDHQSAILKHGDDLAKKSTLKPEHLAEYARYCVNFGLPVPSSVTSHPLWTDAVDWKTGRT